MLRGMYFGMYAPFMMIRVFSFSLFTILVVLTVIFWVVYGINKFKWAKITAIVLSSILGLFFVSGIILTILRGFMPINSGMLKGFYSFRHGIRRF